MHRVSGRTREERKEDLAAAQDWASRQLVSETLIPRYLDLIQGEGT